MHSIAPVASPYGVLWCGWVFLISQLLSLFALTAYCVDIDPHEPWMYEWLSKPFGRSVCAHHAIWVNHTEIRCYTPWPQRAGAVGHFWPYRGGAMRKAGYELRRIPLPRTRVNKG